jgi:hypothetical protein
MTKAEWIWMPHPAHFICRHECRFSLATYVGGFIVSTIGERVPSESVQSIIASARGIKLSKRGEAREHEYLTKIGFESFGIINKKAIYETMVFRAKPSQNVCCPFEISDGQELVSLRHETPDEATRQHYALCEKWSTKA